MSIQEQQEFKALQAKLFGNAMFAVMNQADPEVIRYDELAAKYLQLRRAAAIAKLSPNAQRHLILWSQAINCPALNVKIDLSHTDSDEYKAIKELEKAGFAVERSYSPKYNNANFTIH